MQHLIYIQFTTSVHGIKISFPNIAALHAMSVMYNSLLANTYSKFLFEGEGIKYFITSGCFKTLGQSAGHFVNFQLSF